MSLRTDATWCAQLGGPAPDAALHDLRSLLLRALRFGLAGYAVSDGDLEDFVQETLLKVLQDLPSYRGEARFTTWAQKVAMRVALTELRRRRWRDVSLEDLLVSQRAAGAAPVALAGAAPDPERLVTQRLVMERVMATLHRLMAEELTERQRTAMQAVMEGGMPLQEVASRMGTNRNALYKLLHDARQRLQNGMLREGIDPQDVLALLSPD